jgi:hypothetical protein
LTGELNVDQVEMLEKVAAACPVRRSIETGMEFVEHLSLRPGTLSRVVDAA